jgi:SAM-dependent methyltransferase
VHETSVFPRRLNRLVQLCAEVLPRDARVLDIGCGDGRLAQRLSQLRPDLSITGIDVLVRDKVYISVAKFDGCTIPYPNHSFDVAMLMDVLHHTADPVILLREAARVSKGQILIKDHTRDGLLADWRLRFMDYVGNARYGVNLPFNYWPRSRWEQVWRELGLNVASWNSRLQLYPWPATYVFDASLQFLTCLTHEAH